MDGLAYLGKLSLESSLQSKLVVFCEDMKWLGKRGVNVLVVNINGEWRETTTRRQITFCMVARSHRGKNFAGIHYIPVDFLKNQNRPLGRNKRGRVMLNKALLIGNLGSDPEINYTQSGTAVANLSIAMSERWKDKDGNQQEKTEWHRVVAFGRLAEICGEYLAKGSKIYIEGRIQTRQWEDKDGNKRYTTEIVAREVKFLDGKEQNQGGSQGQKQQEQKWQAPSVSDGDIPF